jgi:hypothetical protein
VKSLHPKSVKTNLGDFCVEVALRSGYNFDPGRALYGGYERFRIGDPDD